MAARADALLGPRTLRRCLFARLSFALVNVTRLLSRAQPAIRHAPLSATQASQLRAIRQTSVFSRLLNGGSSLVRALLT